MIGDAEVPSAIEDQVTHAGLRRGVNHGRGMIIKRAAMSLGGAAIVALGGAYLLYSREMRTTRDCLSAGSEVVQTQHGPIEYTTLGDGPAVLVVHGAGGGYDQGSLIARAYGGEDFRWISPSRFGYLSYGSCHGLIMGQ